MWLQDNGSICIYMYMHVCPSVHHVGIYEDDMRGIRSRKAKAMLAAVKECIAQRWDLNQLNKNGVSLLHIAAANGYYQICRLLLDAGAHLHILDDLGYTALHMAAKYNQVHIYISVFVCTCMWSGSAR